MVDRGRGVLVVTVAMLLGACGASDGSASSTPAVGSSLVATTAASAGTAQASTETIAVVEQTTPTTLQTTTTASLAPWSIGPAEPSPAPTDESTVDIEQEPAPTDLADALTEGVAYGVIVEPPPVEPTPLDEDPCRFLELAEWAEWVGDPLESVSTIPLEYGDVCGYLTSDDRVRAAVLAYPLTPSQSGLSSLLPPDVEQEGVPLSNRIYATWAIEFPVPESSTLIVKTPTHEILIEMSARDDTSRDSLRDGAARFAESIMAGLKS